MVVNWKEPGAQDRLVGTLLAAHPELKLNYGEMALIYDKGATYDAVEGQFRKFRKMAEKLRAEAVARGATLGSGSRPARGSGGAPRSGVAGLGTTPRNARATTTPCNSGGRVTKTGAGGSGSGTGRGRKGKAAAIAEDLDTPTKSGRTVGESILDAIQVESDGDAALNDVNMAVKEENDAEDNDTIIEVDEEEKISIKEEDGETMTEVEDGDADANANEDGGSESDGMYA